MQKTGSTWLQQLIFPQIQSLDIIYKDSFRESIYKWQNKNLLVSYENYVGFPHYVEERLLNGFMSTRRNALRNLGELFPNANVVLVLREQVSFIKSLYNQYIKVGGSISFSEYIYGEGKYSLEKDALKYENLINEIRECIDGEILVVNFSLFKENKKKFGSVISEFLDAKENIDFESSGSRSVNKSLTNRQILLLRRINSVFKNKYSPKGIYLPRPIYKALRAAIVKTTGAESKHDETLLTEKDEEYLKAYYSDDWSAITHRMGREGFFVLSNGK
jgi:hypothetical protein